MWGWTRRSVAAGVLSAGLLLSGATGAMGDSTQLLSPDQAASSISQADPDALAPVPAKGNDGSPTVQTPDQGKFSVDGTNVDSTMAVRPTDGTSVTTDGGQLTVVPEDVAASASDGQSVDGGSAVGYANTSKDADTFVKPTEDGVETFTNIRSDAAPEDFAWKIDLEGGQKLQMAGNTVQVIDPSIDVNAAGTKPDPLPTDADTLAKLQERGLVSKDAFPADPATDLSDPLSGAGLAENPQDKNDLKAVGLSMPTIAGRQHAPDGAPQMSGKPPSDIADQAAALDDAAKSQARHDYDAAAADPAQSARVQQAVGQINPAGNPTTAQGVVATISAPEATDGDGKPVDVSLSVQGDTVTMHVPHNEDTVYPVAADPYILVSEAHWEWRYGPVWHATPKQVGTTWSFDKVGEYWSAVIWWVAPSQRIDLGYGNYAVWLGWGWGYMNAYQPWSSIYTWVQHPVYSNTWDDWYPAWVDDQYEWTDLFTGWYDDEDNSWGDDDATRAFRSGGPGAGSPNQIMLQTSTNNVIVRKGPGSNYGAAPAFDHHGHSMTAPPFAKGRPLLAMAHLSNDWLAVAIPVPGSTSYYARGYVEKSDVTHPPNAWPHVKTWPINLSAPAHYDHSYAVTGGYTSIRNSPQDFTIGYLYSGDHFFDTNGGPHGAKQYVKGWASGGAHVNGYMPYCKTSGGGQCAAFVP